LLTIQLLARWASAIIMRYVAEAPLEAVTEEYRRANATLSLHSMAALEPAKVAIAASSLNLSPDAVEQLQEELTRLRAKYSELEGEVTHLAVESRKRPRSGSEFIINPVSRKVHKPACAQYSQLPPIAWRSVCGWKFGLCPFLPSDELPRPEQACSKCIPELARADSDPE
jgi:septum formation topological specificity factor MinE